MTSIRELSSPAHVRPSRRRGSALRHFGAGMLGRLYHAISAGRHSARNMLKRSSASGLNSDQLAAIVRHSRGGELCRAFSHVGEEHLRKAVYWSEVGVKTRARDHYLDASLWLLAAALQANHRQQRDSLLQHARQSYAIAAPNFQHPAQAVSIPYPGGVINGYFRVPENLPANENVPCVILFGALSMPKEELHITENALLASGLATISFDYPGNGELFDSSNPVMYSLDVGELANALLVFLSSRPQIDVSRVAALGTSFGGRLALYAAALMPDRLKAVAAVSPPLDVLSDVNLLVPELVREGAVGGGCATNNIQELAQRTPLAPLLPELTTPLLVVAGERDIIAPPDEARAIYDSAACQDKKLIVCAGAGHNCFEMMPSLRHEIVQWLVQRL